MKLHFIKSPLILVLILSITATSCLKDKAYENGSIQSGSGGSGQDVKVVSLGLTASDVTNFLQLAFDLSNSDTTVDIVPVELGGISSASQDIHVTLTVNDQLVDDYNSANGTDFTNPGSIITIVNNVVTIPKGSRTGFLQIKFKSLDLLSGSYALGFTISSVTEAGYTISGNLKDGIVALSPKNKYDGRYDFTINTIGWAAYGISDGVSRNWPSNMTLITSGASSVTFSTPEDGPLQPAFTSTGGATGFGATAPQFTFDANDKLISVDNLAPPDSRNRAFHLNTAVADSRYDPSTKTIFAAYIMTQSGRPDQQIYDTLVYVGPR